MKTVTYHIPNISCGHCVHTIKMEVAELKGVESVEASADSKTATIAFDLPAPFPCPFGDPLWNATVPQLREIHGHGQSAQRFVELRGHRYLGRKENQTDGIGELRQKRKEHVLREGRHLVQIEDHHHSLSCVDRNGGSERPHADE